MPRILSVSRNPRLLVTRNDALALAGYGVASPKELDDAVILFSQQQFDAVIIGDSVEDGTRKSLITAIRDKRPDTPIVFAHAGDSDTREEPLADMSVDVTADSTPLMVALTKLLNNPQAA
jgi:DNA-binding response OmpR family regulator